MRALDEKEEKDPRTRIIGFGDSSINHELMFWVKDYRDVVDICAQIRERICYAFYRDHISMPFPVRHVLVDRQRTELQDQNPGIDYKGVVGKIEIFEPLTPLEKEDLVCSSPIRVYAPGGVHCAVRRGGGFDVHHRS